VTAPARAGGTSPDPRPRPEKPRERALKSVPAPAGSPRSRTAATERAYARRAQRNQNLRGGATAAPQRQPSTVSKAPFVIMVMAMLIVGLAAIMWLSTQAAADSYKLQEAHNQATQLSLRVEQLRQEVALAESPTKLAEAAAKLGLVLAGDPAKLKQLPDGSVEVYGKPSAVEAPAPPPPPPSAGPSSPSPSTGTSAPPPSGEQQQNNPADQQNQQPPVVPGG
jgi:cell division protein FtsL